MDLSEAIATSQPPNCLLIDSLGTWIANLLFQEDLYLGKDRERFPQCTGEIYRRYHFSR